MLGAALRAIDVWRPADGRLIEVWRECDVSAIARNFDREGMNLFYPRIDWRGTGPGYAEMELPLLSWAMAAAYRVIGVHEVVGRLINYALSLVALGVGLALVVYLLPPIGAAAAGVFLALAPLPIRVATSLQPESLMFACYLLAGYAFIRWLDTDRRRDYLVAMGATALSILAKLPAVHLGIFFLIVLFMRRGRRALADWRVWAFAVGALAPGVAWYVHAHHLYLMYGNSLGVSNEPHWLRADFFTHPRYAKGLVHIDLQYVWGWVGVLVAAVGVALAPSSRAVTVGLAWFASVAIYYIIVEHSLSQDWAVYYHVVSVPSAAILFGAGAQALAERARRSAPWFSVAALVPLTYAGQIARVAHDARPHSGVEWYACAQTFAPHIAPGALILASGGNCTDADGEPVTYHSPHMMYWLDRKGFNVCREAESADSAAAFAARGAQYFIAERSFLEENPGIDAGLRRRYAVLAECPVAILFDLREHAK